MSASEPHFIFDDDDVVEVADSTDQPDLLDFHVLDIEPEIFSKRQAAKKSLDERSSRPKPAARHNNQAELPSYVLRRGVDIKPGDTVELKDRATVASDVLHSGDFLRVKHIVKNPENGEVRLRGHRLRRTKKLGPIFKWRLNELAMVLRVREDDDRCPLVAGIEEISVAQVLRLRDCVLTNMEYPGKSFRNGPKYEFPASMTSRDIFEQIFEGGRLACRVVNIIILSAEDKAFSGIVRRLGAHEADVGAATPWTNAGSSITNTINIDDHDEDDDAGPTRLCPRRSVVGTQPQASIAVSSLSNTSQHHQQRLETNPPLGPRPAYFGNREHRARSASFEMLESEDLARQMQFTRIRPKPYTCGDVFCGAGGASQGAKQADLQVRWGVDHDRDAINAYRMNHTGAKGVIMDAQRFRDFLLKDRNLEQYRVDILHLSPPCCYFSPAHTRPGPNDQSNMEALFVVGPILEVLQPRAATLEQTFGLATYEQHKANFLMLLGDIHQAGYNVRYKLQDISEFGLPQQRIRLLMITARFGTPLPPFPNPTHGPAHPGLQPLTTISTALAPLETTTLNPRDIYNHATPFPQPKEPYSPHALLQACITTSGCTKPHFTGLRRFTPRELALLQSFPVSYAFTGSRSEATKQIGNAFPPVMAAELFRSIAKTLEAFDCGFIGADDDTRDLDAVLRLNGIGAEHGGVSGCTGYRYLTPENVRCGTRPTAFVSPFVRKTVTPAVPGQVNVPSPAAAFAAPAGRGAKRVLREYDFGGEIIYVEETDDEDA